MDSALVNRYDEAFRAGDWQTADACARQAVLAAPYDAQALWRFAQLLGKFGDYQGAREYAERAVACDPSEACAWAVLSGAYAPLDMPIECERAASRAIQISGGSFPMAHWNRAHALLRQDRYKEGFKDYEWGAVIGFRRMRCAGPSWDGSPIPGKTLLVWSEQGLGDVIMFSRFIKEAKKRSQAVIVSEVQHPLYTLLRHQTGADVTFGQSVYGQIPCEWDYQVSVASLPYVLGLDYGDIDGSPYIEPVPGMEVEPFPGEVGLVWKGSSTHANDSMRSIPVEEVRRLEECADWVSLQSSPGEMPFEMKDVGSCITDFAFTASALTRVKTLVTCDTSIAHLAGAMGKDVIMVAPLNGEWRWGTSGDTPWYDSMTVVRAKSFTEAIDKVKEELLKRGIKKTVKEFATDEMRKGWRHYRPQVA